MKTLLTLLILTTTLFAQYTEQEYDEIATDVREAHRIISVIARDIEMPEGSLHSFNNRMTDADSTNVVHTRFYAELYAKFVKGAYDDFIDFADDLSEGQDVTFVLSEKTLKYRNRLIQATGGDIRVLNTINQFMGNMNDLEQAVETDDAFDVTHAERMKIYADIAFAMIDAAIELMFIR